MSKETTTNTFKKQYGYLHALLLSVGLFFSQFYTWSSGLPQISNIIILLSIILYVSKNRYIRLYDSDSFVFFIIYVLFINFGWFIIDKFKISYLVSSVYWLFNFIFFITCINLNKNYIEFFFTLILRTITLSYFIEIVIWAIGFGRYNFQPRYNGLFNDPNQMAFWIISTCAIYIFLSNNKKKSFLIFLIALFLILTTLSRSGILGFSFLTLALITKQSGTLKNKFFLYITSLFILSSIIYILIYYGFFDNIIDRLLIALDQKDSQSEARGFEAIVKFPEMLIIGSGQGNYHRFVSTGNEIHSTWLGILFYYGIFGGILFFYFLYRIFSKLTFSDKIIFISPMLYGFFTYNARTTIFWFFISIFILALRSKSIQNER